MPAYYFHLRDKTNLRKRGVVEQAPRRIWPPSKKSSAKGQSKYSKIGDKVFKTNETKRRFVEQMPKGV